MKRYSLMLKVSARKGLVKGNSGGALINLKGEVIGVNTAIASRTNYYMGYGFAVPINIAKSVVDDLKKYGEVKRGYLGVYIAPVDPVIAKGVGLDKPRGVFITSVMKGSAADKADVREGDVVLSVDGKEVNQPNELQAIVGTHNPDEKVTLKVWRDEKEKTIRVTLESRSDDTTIADSKPSKDDQREMKDLGLKIRDLSELAQDMYELDSGVMVVSVESESAAAKARIIRGDVIVSLNGKSLKSVDAFYEVLSDLSAGEVVKLKLRSLQGKELFDRLVFLEIPE